MPLDNPRTEPQTKYKKPRWRDLRRKKIPEVISTWDAADLFQITTADIHYYVQEGVINPAFPQKRYEHYWFDFEELEKLRIHLMEMQERKEAILQKLKLQRALPSNLPLK